MRIYLISLFLLAVSSSISSQINKINLLFAGDAMQHKSQIDAAKTNDGYDYSKYFKHVKNRISAADIAIVNLEVTLAGKPYTGFPNFSAPDQFAFALKDAGFDIFLTANNHCLDKLQKGLERTIYMLDSMNVKHTGTFTDSLKRELFYPLMIIKNGIRIAMLNYTYSTNGIPTSKPNVVNSIDKEQIRKDILAAQQMKADIIIANMHWGDEYHLKHNRRQKEIADYLISKGVKLIIGSHPHVVQPIDIRRNKNGEIDAIIVYSLGNFISGMKPVDTTGGMIFNVEISKEKGKALKIESCDYNLIWTYKPMRNDHQPDYQLLPVEDFDNDEGQEKIEITSYQMMKTFSENAKNAIESLWTDK